MLIKHPDDPAPLLAELESLAQGTGVAAQQAARELQRRRAGLRGEEQARYLIDFEFANSEKWAVLHDLRLEHAGLTAQIDHVMINRWLEVYVLETKHVHAGIKITADGEFLQWNAFRKTYDGMPSPLEQNQRHIKVLSLVMEGLSLPERLGFNLKPSFHSVVLVAAQARIERSKQFDSSRVIKADQLRKRIDRDINEESILHTLASMTKMVSRQTLSDLASQLARCHRPTAHSIAAPLPQASVVKQGKPRIEPRRDPPLPATQQTTALKPTAPPLLPDSTASIPLPSTVATTPSPLCCKSCASTQGQILYGKFGYYFKCAACQGNTAIRLQCQPGHQPRLRKAGNLFHRDCPQCGISSLFFRNPPA